MKPLQPSSPHIVALVGAPGSGKTQFANEFAKMFNTPLISTTNLETLSSDNKAITETTLTLLEEFLKTKQTIILDGTTDQRTIRMRITRLAKKYGYRTLFVWVQTDMVTAKSRWIKLYSSDDGSFEHKLKQFSAPHDSEPYVVISGRHTFNTQARAVLKRLSNTRPEQAVPAPRPAARGAVANRINIG